MKWPFNTCKVQKRDGGTAAKFDNEEALFRILDRLVQVMGAEGMQMLTGNNAFASRMSNGEFLESVLRIATMATPTATRKALHLHNARLMDKISILEEKLQQVPNKVRFLDQFCDRPKTRVALRKEIDAW